MLDYLSKSPVAKNNNDLKMMINVNDTRKTTAAAVPCIVEPNPLHKIEPIVSNGVKSQQNSPTSMHAASLGSVYGYKKDEQKIKYSSSLHNVPASLIRNSKITEASALLI